MRYVPLALLLAAVFAVPAAAADTILVVGDSHTAGAFGRNIDDVLRRGEGNRVATYGICSASPQSFLSETPHHCGFLLRDFSKSQPAKWLGKRVYKTNISDGKGGTREVTMIKTPPLDQLLTDHVPTLTVVALGANGLTKSSIEKTLKLIHDAGSACVWIGPPDSRKRSDDQTKALYKALTDNKVTATATLEESKKDSCLLIDSYSFSYLRYPEKGGDGTHYSGGELDALAAKWGADAADKVLAAFKP